MLPLIDVVRCGGSGASESLLAALDGVDFVRVCNDAGIVARRREPRVNDEDLVLAPAAVPDARPPVRAEAAPEDADTFPFSLLVELVVGETEEIDFLGRVRRAVRLASNDDLLLLDLWLVTDAPASLPGRTTLAGESAIDSFVLSCTDMSVSSWSMSIVSPLTTSSGETRLSILRAKNDVPALTDSYTSHGVVAVDFSSTTSS